MGSSYLIENKVLGQFGLPDSNPDASLETHITMTFVRHLSSIISDIIDKRKTLNEKVKSFLKKKKYFYFQLPCHSSSSSRSSNIVHSSLRENAF